MFQIGYSQSVLVKGTSGQGNGPSEEDKDKDTDTDKDKDKDTVVQKSWHR